MRKSLIAASIASVLWSSPGRTAEPLTLKPSSKWLVNYADDSCRLAREFGEGDQRVVLFLDQLQPGDWFQIIVGGKPIRARDPDRARGEFSLSFGPSDEASDVEAHIVTLGKLPALLVSGVHRIVPLTEAEKAVREAAFKKGGEFDPPPVGAEREKAVTTFEISKGLRQVIVLQTGPMDKPLAALRECAWDTIRSWGLDIEQQKTLSRRAALKDPEKPWIGSNDYPVGMALGGYEGVVNFRLLIDAQGTATSCHIQTSTRPKEFDDAVCRSVMKRARFNPALDAKGNPVPSYFRRTVNFRLEP